MKTRKSLYLLLVLLLSAASVSAATYRSGKMTWSSTINARGLYGRMSKMSQHTIALRISPNIYSGDVELPGNIFTGHSDDQAYVAVGDNNFMNQVGASLAFQYTYRQNGFVAYRAQVTGGLLRGKGEFTRHRINSAGEESDPLFYREFKSTFVEYSFGVEFYPIPTAGLFLYAGVSGTTGIIDRNFNNTQVDRVVCTVPMVPVGLGYKVDMGNFQLGFELMWHPALIDQKGMNLDGWPARTEAANGLKYFPIDPKTNRFTDSFAEFGITFGYRLPML